MRAVLAILRVSFRQALGGKRMIALGLVGAIPAMVTWLANRNLTGTAAIERFYDAPFGILFIIVLPICAMVIGTGALGDERRDGTLSFLLLRPIPRSVIVIAKFVTAWGAATLIAGGSAVLAALVLGLQTGYYSAVFPIFVAVAISTAAYTAVFIVLGHLTSRAVLIGLVYTFIWESSITFAAPGLANASLFRIGITAYAAMVPESQRLLTDVIGTLTPGPWGAIAKAVVIGALAVAGLAWMLRRRDALSE